MEIKPEHLEINTYPVLHGFGTCAWSGVSIRHIPTGIVAECGEERSTHRNKETAYKLLSEKLNEWEARLHQQPMAVDVVVSLTPSWAGVLPMLITAVEFGAPEGKRIARDELARMARAADLWNTKEQTK